ncbi:MAG: hypothetical protein A2638_04215 [Nitrospirae bacterium RIFCSPHIGHO2_01_FULL_66_17]|nr:MAG: hypothetical protein A2638_04215 [Nitrospirae bacterium RIFCSPHIGHO2_01_FULL_66_17]
MDLELTPKALDRLAEAGFDPVFGARPLRRAVQSQIENPLAQEILAGKFGPRDVIVVDAAADTLTFRRKDAAARDVQGSTSVAKGRMSGATKAKTAN